MNYVAQSILAAITFYDSFDFPLTLLEIEKFLVHPKRLGVSGNFKLPKLNEVLINLSNLIDQKIVGEKDGFYFLLERERIAELRINREKISAQKWKKLVGAAKFFQLVPNLKGIFVSGSMGINNSGDSGDFDILAVMKSGRIYSGRIFLSLVAMLLGMRRTRYQKIAPDKFCFNHYLSEDGLEIQFQSLYAAQNYANMVPLFWRGDLLTEFYRKNNWIRGYLWNFKVPNRLQKKEVRDSWFFLGVAKTTELLTSNWLGDQLERIFRWWQQKRIEENPATYESGGRVIFNNQELEFHPRSFESKLINSYNNKMNWFGVGVDEQDSGLNH
jgi:hypothetical protein